MRDYNILKNFKREISLKTKVLKDKTKYTRKNKHKNRGKNIERYRMENLKFMAYFEDIQYFYPEKVKQESELEADKYIKSLNIELPEKDTQILVNVFKAGYKVAMTNVLEKIVS